MSSTSGATNFLRALVEPEHPNIDIVAVHGLNPTNAGDHAEATWTSLKSKRLWLSHFLPLKLPNARILLFGYNSNVAINSSTAGVREHAQLLLNRLKLKRIMDPDRPVIFIAHSLGGIVVKQALVDAKISGEYESIRTATYGLVFFATPHRGGEHVKLGMVAGKVVRAILGSQKNDFMDAFEKDALFSDSIREHFRHLLLDYHILSFYETMPFRNLGLIVEPKSASLGLPGKHETCLATEADHVGICKFETADGDDYDLVESNIVQLVEGAVKAGEPQRRSSAPSQSEVPSGIIAAQTLHHTVGEILGTTKSLEECLQLILFLPTEWQKVHHGLETLSSRLQDNATKQQDVVQELASQRHLWQSIESRIPSLLKEFRSHQNSKSQTLRPSSRERIVLSYMTQLETRISNIERYSRPTSSSWSSQIPSEKLLRAVCRFLEAVAVGIQKLLQTLILLYPRVFRLFIIMKSIARSPSLLLPNNITFEDALGRVKSLPYEQFRHWDVFTAMLRCEFKGLPGEHLIIAGQYRMKLKSSRRLIRSRQEWEHFVSSRAWLTMSVILDSSEVKVGVCPRCNTNNETAYAEVQVTCQKCLLEYSQSTISLIPGGTRKRDQFTSQAPTPPRGPVVAQSHLSAPVRLTEPHPTLGDPSISASFEEVDYSVIRCFRRVHYQISLALDSKHWRAYPRTSIAHQRGNSSDPEIFAKMIKLMQGPDLRLMERWGSIYVFRRNKDQGVLKIGCTLLPGLRKIEQWRSKCHYRPILITESSQPAIRGVSNLERLIFTALESYRRAEIICNFGKGCGLMHREWFHLSEEKALSTVQRWTAWMECVPYDGEGNLNEFWVHAIDRLLRASQNELDYLSLLDEWLESETARWRILNAV